MSYRLLKRRCWINSRVHSGMQVGIFHITGGGHLGKQRFTSHWTSWWTSATNDFVGALVYVEDLYSWIIKDLGRDLAILGPSDILWVYTIISCVFAIAAAIPAVAYQTWGFIAPVLTKEERKVTQTFIPGLFILFIVGISFGYFLLFSIVLEFLTTMSAGQFEMMFTADNYFRFMINLVLLVWFSIWNAIGSDVFNMIRNSQSSKVGKSVESILFFSGSRIN